MVAIEVKHGTEFRREHRKGIEALAEHAPVESYIVYLGDRQLEVEGTRVLPLETFLLALHGGDTLG